jgi:hypothetical protein
MSKIKDEMGRVSGMRGEIRIRTKFCLESLKGRNHLEEIGIDRSY